MHKKYLITGSSGFIGTNMYLNLKKKNSSLWCLDKNVSKYEKIKEFSRLDLSDEKKTKKFFSQHSFDYVINFAALSGIINCDKNPDLAIKDNILSIRNILNYSKTKKIVIITSYSTLDEKSFSFYAACKKINEQLLDTNFSKKNIIIIRLSNIFGPYSLHKKSVIHQLCKSIQRKSIFNIHGTGNQKRNYIFVEDLIKVILVIIHKKKFKGIINIGSSDNWSIKNLIKMFNKLTNSKIRCKNVRHPLDDKFTKTKKIVDKPHIFIKDKNFLKKLKKTLDWYNDQKI
tara:strand:+ start:6806 stop:7663 length:858 start_codon:yes stop_codon:yes gene_type:complete